MAKREVPLDISRDDWLNDNKYPYWLNERNFVTHGNRLMGSAEFDPHHPTLGRQAALITVAETGKTYKGNSMTTTHLHRQGKVFLPERIFGVHYYVDTLAEGQVVYNGYDLKDTVKGAKDILNSALLANGIFAKSAAFKSGYGTTGVNIAFNAFAGRRANGKTKNMEECVAALKKSLQATDKILALAEEIRAGKIAKHTSVIGAELLTYRKAIRVPDAAQRAIRIAEWEEFWGNFVRSRGGQIGDGNAPYNVLWNKLAAGVAGGGGSREVTLEWTEKALYAFEKREGAMGQQLRTVSLSTYCVLRGFVVVEDEPAAKDQSKRRKATESAAHRASAR